MPKMLIFGGKEGDIASISIDQGTKGSVVYRLGVLLALLTALYVFSMHNFSLVDFKRFVIDEALIPSFSFANTDTVGTDYISTSDENVYSHTGELSLKNPLGTLKHYYTFEIALLITLGIVLIFVFAQFVNNRKLVYLYYSAYLLISLLYFLRSWSFDFHEGVLRHYYLKIGVFSGEVVLSAAIMLTYAFFVLSFLKIKRKYGLYRKMMNFLIYWSIIFIFTGIGLGLATNRSYVALEILYKIVCLPPTLIVLYIIRTNPQTASVRAIVAGMSLLIVGVFLTGILGLQQAFTQRYIYMGGKLFYYKLGILAEVVFFVLALGLRDREEETRRVLEKENRARDLHDGLNANLSIVNSHLSILEEQINRQIPPSLDTLQKTKKLVLASMTEVESVVQANRHEKGSVADLARSIREHLEDSFPLGSVPQFIFNDYTLGTSAIRSESILQLGKLCNEAFNNIIKHAACTTLSVTLKEENSQLLLCIADDGKGFEPNVAAKKGGLGLSSMRNRVEALEGEIAISSNKPKGTKIFISIPLVSLNSGDVM